MCKSDPGNSVDAFNAIGHDGCRYAEGEVGEIGFAFCGAKQREGSSYCAHHHAVCYTRKLPRLTDKNLAFVRPLNDGPRPAPVERLTNEAWDWLQGAVNDNAEMGVVA